MKVRELIAQLEKMEPQLLVFITSPNGECLEPVAAIDDILQVAPGKMPSACVSITTNVAG